MAPAGGALRLMGTQATQGCSSRWVPQDLRGPCPAGFLEEVAGKEGTAEEVSDVAHPHRAGVLEPRRGRRGSRLEPSLSPGQWPQLPLLWPLSRCPACCPPCCLDYGLLSLLASVPCAPQAGAKAADKDMFAFLPGDSTLALCQPRPRPPAQRGRRPSKVPGCTGCAGLARGPTGREPGLWSLLLRLWLWHQGAGDMEGFAGG